MLPLPSHRQSQQQYPVCICLQPESNRFFFSHLSSNKNPELTQLAAPCLRPVDTRSTGEAKAAADFGLPRYRGGPGAFLPSPLEVFSDSSCSGSRRRVDSVASRVVCQNATDASFLLLCSSREARIFLLCINLQLMMCGSRETPPFFLLACFFFNFFPPLGPTSSGATE